MKYLGQQNRIKIKELDLLTLEAILNFVYTDSFDPELVNISHLVSLSNMTVLLWNYIASVS